MGRPAQTEPLANISAEVKRKIVELRQRGTIPLGAKIIRAKLVADPRLVKHLIPSTRSISRYLRYKGLSRPYNKRQPFEDNDLPKTTFAHERWQLDAKGAVELRPLGYLVTINIKDMFSRITCGIYPTVREKLRGLPNRNEYQNAIRLAGIYVGLPQELQTDHESIFFENKGNSAFPTVFHMWLTALGVKLVFSRVKRPTDQGLIERAHQAVNSLIQQQDVFELWHVLFNACVKERDFLNHHLPLPGEKEEGAFTKTPQAKHSGRFYNPSIEEQLLDLDRVYAMLDGCKWYRAVSTSHSFQLGGHSYYAKEAKGEKQVCITFQRMDKMLYVASEQGVLLQKLPIKGITKEILMGDLYNLRVGVQLELQFAPNQPNLARLFGTNLV